MMVDFISKVLLYKKNCGNILGNITKLMLIGYFNLEF